MAAPTATVRKAAPTATDEADVELFKELLRINTMHPQPQLAECVEWLRGQAAALGLQFKVVQFHDGLPIAIASAIGTQPELPSVVLNCHMDVVPVFPDKWTALPEGKTPFSAWEDPANGRIYARGSQDMKCVGAQYLCALRRLAAAGRRLRRTVHTVWVPDEEIGGQKGMLPFVTSPEFRALNPGVVMDEGLAFDENVWVVHYGERTPLWIEFAAEGEVGHGAKLIEGTAMERLSRVVAAMQARRDRSVKLLAADPRLAPGDVTTVNWTCAQAGVSNDGGRTFAYNVIPRSARVVFDVRVAHDDYWPLMEDCKALCAQHGLTMAIVNGDPKGPSRLSPKDNAWYATIEAALKEWGAPVVPAIFPAATDSRFVRKVGVPAYGFSPMRHLPSLLHDHNEYLPRSTYLEGVAVYEHLIARLADLPADSKL